MELTNEQREKVFQLIKDHIGKVGNCRVGWAISQIAGKEFGKSIHNIEKIANTIIQSNVYIKENSLQVNNDFNIFKNPQYTKESNTELVYKKSIFHKSDLMNSLVSSEKKPFCFVLMPFDESFDDIYNLGIKESCNEAGAYCERVDEQIFLETILERIYNQISEADIVIADMTGRNSNVFYEVGFAHALKKPTILLTQEVADIPFDLKHFSHIIYNNKITFLKNELKKRIQHLISNPTESNKNIQIGYVKNDNSYDFSEKERELIIEASKDPVGQILYISIIGGLQVSTNDKQLNEDDGPRTRALWDSIFKNLINKNIIEDVGYKGEIFQLTDLGYKIADILLSKS